MLSGLPVGSRWSCSRRSVPGARRHARSSGATVGITPGDHPRKWPSGLMPSVKSIPPIPGSRSAPSSRLASPVGSRCMMAWCNTRGLPGRNSIARTYLVPCPGTGTTNFLKTSGPSAGTSNGSLMRTTKSGSPSCHPRFQSGAGGRSARFPRGAPLATHRWIVAISASVRRRSPANVPWPGSGGHGGIARAAVTSAIWRARRFTSS